MSQRSRGERMMDLSLNAIELIDRNLYERTCDVRWWATDSAVVDCAASPAPAAVTYASERLGVILLDRGYVTKQIIGKMLEMQRGIPYVNLSAYPIDEILVRSLPERVIMEHKIVPLARSGDEIHLAMLDPSDIMAIDTVGRFLHGKVRPFLTTESDFSWVVNKYFGVERKVGESLTEARPGHEEPEAGAAGAAGTAVGVVEAFDDSPVVRVLNTIVQDAVRIGATDIHVEPEADETPVRFRIDGLLVDKTVLPRAVADGTEKAVFNGSQVSFTPVANPSTTSTVNGKELKILQTLVSDATEWGMSSALADLASLTGGARKRRPRSDQSGSCGASTGWSSSRVQPGAAKPPPYTRLSALSTSASATS